jgi:hypothetical protein
MQVIIPTAVEPHNPCLPYALASIRVHTDLEPVTIGHDFYLCDHIPTAQATGRVNARRNTNLAMRVACETGCISDPFVWSNDDIYWLKPAAPIRWALGKLEDATGSRLNRERKADTARALTAMGLPTFDYEAHVPMLISKAPMLTALDIADTDPNLEKRSLYGNMTGLPDRIAPDVKLRNPTNRHRDEAWASTQGDPARYPNLAGLLVAERR